MLIRNETRQDAEHIRRVVEAAFPSPDEARLVDALRENGDIVISLVAEQAGEIIGHILFSKLKAPIKCLALAPVSVLPDRQNQGIGSDLIRTGLAQASKEGWLKVFVLGEPAYYRRFGFDTNSADGFASDYPKPYFMAIDLDAAAQSLEKCNVIYASPFLALG